MNMNIVGGRAGPFTVLFALVFMAVEFLFRLVMWGFVGVVIVLILAGKGIRYLYRRWKRGRELHERDDDCGYCTDLRALGGDLPMPPVSPVEHPEYPDRKEG